jgi:hypothetical protein
MLLAQGRHLLAELGQQRLAVRAALLDQGDDIAVQAPPILVGESEWSDSYSVFL